MIIEEYARIPFQGKRLVRYEEGDFKYRAEFDEQGYKVLEESSHNLLCGSKFLYTLWYKGRLIYSRSEHGLRLSRHTSNTEYKLDLGNGEWSHAKFAIFKDLGVPDVREVSALVRYVIQRLKGTKLEFEVEYLKRLQEEHKLYW